MVAGTTLLMLSCSPSSKRGEEGIRVLMKDTVSVSAPQRMPLLEREERITSKGKEYLLTLVRCADDALPMVKNEEGELYVDNHITVRLTCGGKRIVEKSFTKNDFAQQVDARFLKYAILESMVYEKVTPQGISCMASLCYPQTDLCVPVRLTFAADGHVSMMKVEQLEDVYETDSIH